MPIYGSQNTIAHNEDVKHNRDENTMQTENLTEEPTNGNILGTGMITMGHLWIHLTLTVQEAIRDNHILLEATRE